MSFTLVCFGLAFLIYFICGLVLTARICSLGECSDHKQEWVKAEERWIIIFFWLPCAYFKLWKDGTVGL